MKTVGFVSLGCAKNLNDAEAMLGLLDQAGYKIVDNPVVIGFANSFSGELEIVF